METSPDGRPPESYGLVRDRTNGEGAQFVHAFFDRFENVSPRFVSRLPSLLLSIIVFNVILALMADSVAMERRMHHDSLDPLLRGRWVVMLLVVILVGMYVGGLVGSKWYMRDSIKYNKQHFANVFWIREYLKALRSGI